MTVEKMRYKYSSAMVAIVAHILLLVVCILQLRAIAVVSTAEAKNGITIDTGGLTRREEHTVISDSEKALRAYIDDEFIDLVAFAFKYEASSLHLDTKGWSPSTVKNKLIWWNWTIVFVIGLAVAIRTRWKMHKALDAEKNHGTIIMEKVSSYDEAFDKRSVAYLLTLLILWAFGIVTYHPIFFGLLGLAIVEWLEAARFKSYGGIIFGNKEDGSTISNEGSLKRKIAETLGFGNVNTSSGRRIRGKGNRIEPSGWGDDQ